MRLIHLFQDGRVERSSIAFEERDGRPCPSLIDVPLAEGFEGADLAEIDLATFDAAWAIGIDTPLWNL